MSNKNKEKDTAPITNSAAAKHDEPCSLQELNTWSAGRWLAGQHQAAHDVQTRYEALARFQNQGNELDFTRDEETGELSFTIRKESEEQQLAKLEAEEQEELKRKALDDQAKRDKEKNK